MRCRVREAADGSADGVVSRLQSQRARVQRGRVRRHEREEPLLFTGGVGDQLVLEPFDGREERGTTVASFVAHGESVPNDENELRQVPVVVRELFDRVARFGGHASSLRLPAGEGKRLLPRQGRAVSALATPANEVTRASAGMRLAPFHVMRDPFLLTLAVAATSFSVACGDTMDADADMNRDLDRVSERAALVETELDAHASAVAAAGDLGAIETAEGRHRTVMGPHMDDLDHLLADMTTYCRHRATREVGRTHDMQAAMTGMRAEMDRHRLAARQDVTTARAEEERHVRDSRGILTAMRDAGAAMRHDAGLYRCEHGNH